MKYLEKLANTVGNFGVFFPGEDDLKEILGKEKMEIGNPGGDSEDGYAPLSEGNIQAIEKQAYNRLVHTEIIKQKNINSVIREAESNFSADAQVDEKEVDIDWILKFMDISGNISDKALQKVWGRILASKVKDTSIISLHSLFVLANISSKEAELFTKLSKYVVNLNGVNVLWNDNKFNEKYGIRYSDILKLDEYGLINSSGMLSMNITLTNAAKCPIRYGNKAYLCVSVPKSEVSLQIFALRETGDDLLSVANPVREENYLKDFMNNITKKYENVKFIGLNYA